MKISRYIAIIVALGWGMSAQAQEMRRMLPNLRVERLMPDDKVEPAPYPQPFPQEGQGSETGMHRAPAAVTAVGGVNPIPRVPVILVGFNDWAFQTPKVYFDSLFNGVSWSNQFGGKSISRYFKDCSHGAYEPTFDVFGPVTINGSVYGYRNSDANVVKMACDLLDDSVDFSLYDYNNDGRIDLVFYIFAGYGSNEANLLAKMQNPPVAKADMDKLIWPHYVANGALGKGSYDGKQLCDYEASNELDGLMALYQERGLDVNLEVGNGTATHEFCHALGLPDLYGPQSAARLGSWDIMDQGTYNGGGYIPAGLSAWERWWMGWLTPTRLQNAVTDTLPSLLKANTARYIADTDITNPRADNGEFYILENRQFKGWDSQLPGHGLLITRIRYKNTTWQGSNNYSPYGVIYLRAESGRAEPVTEAFDTAVVYPSASSQCATLELTDIAELHDTIVYRYKGGTPTGVEPECKEESVKCKMVNGKVLIQHGRNYYDMQGRLVMHEAPERRNIPAFPGIIEKVDADGDTIHIRLKGDERKHWTTTEDGYEIKQQDGRFYYVDKKGKISKRKAKDADRRSKCDKCWIKRHTK